MKTMKQKINNIRLLTRIYIFLLVRNIKIRISDMKNQFFFHCDILLLYLVSQDFLSGITIDIKEK